MDTITKGCISTAQSVQACPSLPYPWCPKTNMWPCAHEALISGFHFSDTESIRSLLWAAHSESWKQMSRNTAILLALHLKEGDWPWFSHFSPFNSKIITGHWHIWELPALRLPIPLSFLSVMPSWYVTEKAEYMFLVLRCEHTEFPSCVFLSTYKKMPLNILSRTPMFSAGLL